MFSHHLSFPLFVTPRISNRVPSAAVILCLKCVCVRERGRQREREREREGERGRGREREEQGTKKSKIYDSVVASSLKNKEEY